MARKSRQRVEKRAKSTSARPGRRRRLGESLMTILALGSFLVYPAKQAFATINWNAYLNAVTTSGARSKSISLNWSTEYGTTCTPEKLMLRYNKDTGSPDPTKPLRGTLLKYLDTDESSTQHLLAHARTKYAYTIYACESANCLNICTATTNESDDATTARERWVVAGVHGYDEDTGARILAPNTWTRQNDPELYRFESGTSYSGKIAIYFNGQEDGEPAGLFVVHSNDTTWQDNWNATDKWGTPIMIAQGTQGGDHEELKNTIVVPTDDGEANERLRLFWTSYDGDNETTYYRLHSALSTDEDGDDFGLCCADTADCSSTTTCGLLGSEVCCDFDDEGVDMRTEYVAEDGNCLAMSGWHGHDLWDDHGPVWRPSLNELSILFSGDPVDEPEEECGICDVDAPPSDIDMWRWDTGGGCDSRDSDTAAKICLEEVQVFEDTDFSWCPDQKISDRHDPFALAYPDETKVYVKNGQTGWIVGYSTDNGRTIEDTSAIEFYFDFHDSGDTANDTAADTADALDPGCVNDPTILAWKNGSDIHEVMVFIPSNNAAGSTNRDRCFSIQDTEEPIGDGFGGFLLATLNNG